MSHWSILGIGCDTTTMETWCSRIRNAWPVSCPYVWALSQYRNVVIVITGTSAFVQVIGIGTNLSECNLKRWNEQAKWAKKSEPEVKSTIFNLFKYPFSFNINVHVDKDSAMYRSVPQHLNDNIVIPKPNRTKSSDQQTNETYAATCYVCITWYCA